MLSGSGYEFVILLPLLSRIFIHTLKDTAGPGAVPSARQVAVDLALSSGETPHVPGPQTLDTSQFCLPHPELSPAPGTLHCTPDVFFSPALVKVATLLCVLLLADTGEREERAAGVSPWLLSWLWVLLAHSDLLPLHFRPGPEAVLGSCSPLVHQTVFPRLLPHPPSACLSAVRLSLLVLSDFAGWGTG